MSNVNQVLDCQPSTGWRSFASTTHYLAGGRLMSPETTTTSRPRVGRLLLYGLVATMLVAGCGSAGGAPAGGSRPESVTEG